MQPEDLKYSTTHEWARADGEIVTVGISDHAQSELGDVVFVELPAVGTKIGKGDVLGTVESVKTVSDLISPVSGEIMEINEALPETPELVNDDPYSAGWLVKIKLDAPNELDELMSAEQYETFIQEH
jgi:glycine cleavage system H protein